MSKNKSGILPLFGKSFANAVKRNNRTLEAMRYSKRIPEADDFVPKEQLLAKERNHGRVRPSRMNFQGYTVQQRIDSAVQNKVIQALKLKKKMQSKRIDTELEKIMFKENYTMAKLGLS